MREHFGVGLGLENMTGCGERASQLGVVLDDAVVDETQASRCVEVRVSVGICHAAMGGPAGVGDADGPAWGRGFEMARQITDPAGLFPDIEMVAIQQGDTRAVIAAVFETFESFEQDGKRLL